MSATTEPPSEHSPSGTQPKSNDFGYFRLIFGIGLVIWGCIMIYQGINNSPVFGPPYSRKWAIPWLGELYGTIAIMVGTILLMSLRTSRK
jgi:hypothetical protein